MKLGCTNPVGRMGCSPRKRLRQIVYLNEIAVQRTGTWLRGQFAA
jgi:hypothetical protein